jgi:hypothetical protein
MGSNLLKMSNDVDSQANYITTGRQRQVEDDYNSLLHASNGFLPSIQGTQQNSAIKKQSTPFKSTLSPTSHQPNLNH